MRNIGWAASMARIWPGVATIDFQLFSYFATAYGVATSSATLSCINRLARRDTKSRVTARVCAIL